MSGRDAAKITLWPNELGAHATVGRLRFEIWQPERTRGHVAQLVGRQGETDKTFYGVAWKDVGTLPDFAAAATAAAESWRSQPGTWEACS